MEAKLDNIFCACIGALVGIYRFLMNIHFPSDYWSKVVEGVLTAFLCGAAGWIGKEVIQVAWRSLKDYFKKSKSKNDVG